MQGVHLRDVHLSASPAVLLMIPRGKGSSFESEGMKLSVLKSRGLTLTLIKLVLAPN